MSRKSRLYGTCLCFVEPRIWGEVADEFEFAAGFEKAAFKGACAVSYGASGKLTRVFGPTAGFRVCANLILLQNYRRLDHDWAWWTEVSGPRFC